MKTIKKADLLAEPADALIYSTNVLLNMTGGVGAQLMERYGAEIQTDLHRHLAQQGKRFASQGDVIQLVSAGMPWKMVFHTVPCDPMYHTTVDVVARVLAHCLDECLKTPDVRTVSMSALATGYGDLTLDDFITVFNRVAGESRYSERLDITLCLPEDQ